MYKLLWGVSFTVLMGVGTTASTAIAQVYPTCPAPSRDEYLLLVRGQDEAERNRIMAALPADNPVLVCEYLDEVVVRAGGFESLEAANSWALYLQDIEGFEAFVASPSATAVGGTSTDPILAYNPVGLPAGYAVLIDYQDRPDVAREVQQTLGQSVGLAVYQQRPYLLATFSRDGGAATGILQKLTTAQFSAFLVEAQQVVRLIERVQIDE
jgi:hypothetical protein